MFENLPRVPDHIVDAINKAWADKMTAQSPEELSEWLISCVDGELAKRNPVLAQQIRGVVGDYAKEHGPEAGGFLLSRLLYFLHLVSVSSEEETREE